MLLFASCSSKLPFLNLFPLFFLSCFSPLLLPFCTRGKSFLPRSIPFCARCRETQGVVRYEATHSRPLPTILNRCLRQFFSFLRRNATFCNFALPIPKNSGNKQKPFMVTWNFSYHGVLRKCVFRTSNCLFISLRESFRYASVSQLLIMLPPLIAKTR